MSVLERLDALGLLEVPGAEAHRLLLHAGSNRLDITSTGRSGSSAQQLRDRAQPLGPRPCTRSITTTSGWWSAAMARASPAASPASATTVVAVVLQHATARGAEAVVVVGQEMDVPWGDLLLPPSVTPGRPLAARTRPKGPGTIGDRVAPDQDPDARPPLRALTADIRTPRRAGWIRNRGACASHAGRVRRAAMSDGGAITLAGVTKTFAGVVGAGRRAARPRRAPAGRSWC